MRFKTFHTSFENTLWVESLIFTANAWKIVEFCLA